MKRQCCISGFVCCHLKANLEGAKTQGEKHYQPYLLFSILTLLLYSIIYIS